jgi:hypothetical protein
MKHILKGVAAKAISRLEFPVFVSSCGRSGSTMLTQSICRSATNTRFISSRFLKTNMWTIKGRRYDGVVYKTHDYPPSDVRNERYLYIYSDPYAIIGSIYRKYKNKDLTWVNRHARHLKARNMGRIDEVFEKDVFNIEKHFDSWFAFSKQPTFRVRLGALWKYQKELSQFIGCNVRLPPKKSRKTNLKVLNEDTKKRMKSTYGQLRHKMMDVDLSVTK